MTYSPRSVRASSRPFSAVGPASSRRFSAASALFLTAAATLSGVSTSVAGTMVSSSASTSTPTMSRSMESEGPRFFIDLETQFEWSDPTPAGPAGDVIQSRVSVPLFIPLGERWKIAGVIRGGYTDYETSPFGDDGLETWNVGGLITLDGQITDAWSATFAVLGGASWEDGASFSDSFNAGGAVLASYRFSPTLKIGVGGLYLERLNEDPLVVPALALDWQVTDDLDVTLYALDLRAEYDLSDTWSIYVRGEYDPGGALLKDRRDTEADSYDDQGFRTAGGLKWSPTTHFSLSVEGGVAFHEYALRNDNEEELAKDRLDPAPFVGVAARLSF